MWEPEARPEPVSLFVRVPRMSIGDVDTVKLAPDAMVRLRNSVEFEPATSEDDVVKNTVEVPSLNPSLSLFVKVPSTSKASDGDVEVVTERDAVVLLFKSIATL